jgi:hypothetical protein
MKEAATGGRKAAKTSGENRRDNKHGGNEAASMAERRRNRETGGVIGGKWRQREAYRKSAWRRRKIWRRAFSDRREKITAAAKEAYQRRGAKKTRRIEEK